MKRNIIVGGLIAVVGLCASAAVTTYVWDEAATEYGDISIVRDGEGRITTLDAPVRAGDGVVFTGAATVEFAADAQINLGMGEVVFSNGVSAAGALTLRGDSVPQTVTGGADFIEGAVGILPALAGCPTETIKCLSGEIGYYSGSTLVKLNASVHHWRQEGELTTCQLQEYNGAWTRCIKLAMLPTAEGLVVSNMYMAQTANWGTSYVGQDFDDMPAVSSNSYNTSIFLLNVVMKRDQSDADHHVVFAGPTSFGGAIKVADGASCDVTGEAIGAKLGGTFPNDITFANGYFAFRDCGRFTYAGTVSGRTGVLSFVSADLPPSSHEVFSGTVLSGEPQVVLQNVSLASVTGVTAGVSWRRYNDVTLLDPMHDQYVGDGLKAAFFRNIGQKTVARFQARAKTPGWQLNYATGVLFEQAGNDITAKLIGVYDIWPTSAPEDNPWVWDAWNGNPNGRVLSNAYTAVSNLTFQLMAPADAVSHEADITLAGADATVEVDYVFRPGLNRRMTATVTSVNGISQAKGTVHVHDRATLALVCPNVSTDYSPTYQGLWSGQTYPSDLHVHAGGRIYVGHTRINHGSQQITLDGGKMAFHNPENDGGTFDSYRFRRGSFMINSTGSITYRNGALTDGYDVYFGPMGCGRTIKVEGTVPSCAKNGYQIYGQPSVANPARMTFDVEDVTGDDAVDFTMAGGIRYVNYVNACVIKSGVGTLRFEKTIMHPNHPLRIQQGVVELGLTNCLTQVNGVSFEGGALVAPTDGLFVVGGPVALSADSGLALADGSVLKFSDSSAEAWEPEAQLAITADPYAATVYFGTDNAGLTAQQLRRVRWNGERCIQLADGRLKMSPAGFRLLLR